MTADMPEWYIDRYLKNYETRLARLRRARDECVLTPFPVAFERQLSIERTISALRKAKAVQDAHSKLTVLEWNALALYFVREHESRRTAHGALHKSMANLLSR